MSNIYPVIRLSENIMTLSDLLNVGNESPLLKKALPQVNRIAKQVGLDLTKNIISLDGVYNSRENQKTIFNRGMVPNIPDNPLGRKLLSMVATCAVEDGQRQDWVSVIFHWEDAIGTLGCSDDERSQAKI